MFGGLDSFGLRGEIFPQPMSISSEDEEDKIEREWQEYLSSKGWQFYSIEYLNDLRKIFEENRKNEALRIQQQQKELQERWVHEQIQKIPEAVTRSPSPVRSSRTRSPVRNPV